MGTFSSELASHAGRLTGPRIYADANVPAGIVSFMRARLGWDVFFVMEHDDLRRASDLEHFRLARQLRRTLITLDRDYLDDRRFPPAESGGVLVLWAPNELLLQRVLTRVHGVVFSADRPVAADDPAPLDGQKLLADAGWAS
jgi:hypothetical protein